MKKNPSIGHPLLILSVVLLLLNDWYFKPTFHNELTGKLSDFAGLFAFPFLFSSLFPRHKKAIHLLTVGLFVWWNSAYAQPLLDFANRMGVPFIRTIDWTDHLALISVLFSYRILSQGKRYRLAPMLQPALIGLCCLAFVATTLPPQEKRAYMQIDKTYPFDFDMEELVLRLNMVQLTEIRKLSRYGSSIDFDSETDVFHYRGQTDTLALLLDYEQVRGQDSVRYKTSYGEMTLLAGPDSRLILRTVYRTVPTFSNKAYRKKAIKEFEKRIIRPIETYR